MIPAEAIEAAARALWQTNQHDDAWVDEYPEYMDYLRAEATKALEAAATYMRAGGLAAAYARGFSDATDGNTYDATGLGS